MTKAFKNTPLPKTLSPAELNYTENGRGKDHVSKDKEMRLAFLLPVRLHKRFKSICAGRGLKMADEIRVLLERRIEELESGQKKEAEVTRLKQLLEEAMSPAILGGRSAKGGEGIFRRQETCKLPIGSGSAAPTQIARPAERETYASPALRWAEQDLCRNNLPPIAK